MTVSNTKSFNEHVSTGTETQWPFTFDVTDVDQVKVYTIDLNNVKTDVTSSTTIDMTSKTVTYGPVDSGVIVRIERETPVTQNVDLDTQGPLLPQVLEDALDKLTFIAQENKNRSIEAGLTNIKYTGEWTSGYSYEKGQAVSLYGSLYVCRVDHISDDTNKPLDLSSNTYWAIVARRGEKGDTNDAWTYGDIKNISDGSKPHVYLAGRDSAGDGGGGLFVWVSGDQSANVSDDVLEGIWVAPYSDPSGASGAWKRVVEDDIFKPEWFGAVADGVTNDDLAINECIRLLKKEKGGGTVLFTGKEYVFSKIYLESRITLKGRGRDVTKLIRSSSSTGYGIVFIDSDIGVLTEQDVLDLFANPTTTTPYNQCIEDIIIDFSFTDNGILVFGCGYQIRKANIKNTNGYILYSGYGSGGEWNPDMGSKITDVLFEEAGKGVYYNGPHDAHWDNVVGVNLTNAANDTYDAFYFGPEGTGRYFNVHPWWKASASNRARWSFNIETSGSQFLACYGDAGYRDLRIAGSKNYFQGILNGARVTAADSTPFEILIEGDSNVIDVSVNNSNLSNDVGLIQVGTSTGRAKHNFIRINAQNTIADPILFVNDEANHIELYINTNVGAFADINTTGMHPDTKLYVRCNSVPDITKEYNTNKETFIYPNVLPDVVEIVNGAIDVTGKSYVRVRTEGLAASDTLTTINGLKRHQILYLIPENPSRLVTIDNTGNIVLSSSPYSLSSWYSVLVLIGSPWDDGTAIEIGRSV